MLIKITNLKHINNILNKIHKRLKLYNFNLYNIYLYMVLLKLYNFNNVKIKKYNLNKILEVINIEDKKYYNIDIYSISNIYFIKKINYKLYTSNSFTLKISLWYYILYNKFIIYLSEYIFNFIVRINYINYKYPLLLALIRHIFRNRLNKLKKVNSTKYSSSYFKIKYRVIDYKIKHFKYIMVNNPKMAKINYKNKLLKLYLLLSNNDLFYSSKLAWYKSSKINVLYNNYINIIYNIYLVEVNKYNIMGLYSLYWQINRYGDKYQYYLFNYNLLTVIIQNNSLVKLYNNIYYYYILLYNNKLKLVVWYKVINIIILNYINRIFYRYNSKFKLNKYNKEIYNKYLTRVLTNYVFKFKPLDLKIYYNNKFIKYYIESVKKNLDYICNVYLFNMRYNELFRNHVSIVNIINDINLDLKINENLNNVKNIKYYIFNKLISKYYMINWFNILLNQYNFNLKLINSYMNKKNDKSIFKNYLMIKNRANDLYDIWRKDHIDEYIWSFEKSMILNTYIYLLNIYYKLLILIIYNIIRKL